MFLFPKDTYVNRRSQLIQKVGDGLILLTGNSDSPMNYKDNTYHFKQDSCFRYFFGINLANLHATIDCNTGETIIYGDEYSMDDIIWLGQQETLASLGEKVGVNEVLELKKIQNISKNKLIHFLPQYRHDNAILISSILSVPINTIDKNASEKLIKSIVDIRSYKTSEEIIEMENAVNITRAMHISAMKGIKPDIYEYEIVGEIYKTLNKHNAQLSYPIIFSVNGQTLHNHYHGNKMLSGQLVLNDSGAENIAGYAGDITRTTPVSKKFSDKQKEIYQIVLKMEKDSITSLKPGTLYRDVHIHSNRIMLEGLKDLGIVKGDIENMLEEGVGGLFMPHGLGHMIGMDVHDMENLGENFVGYKDGLKRSTQLGLKSLRLARELEEGFVLTVEPGIYFIPQLIEKMKSEKQFFDFVDYSKLEGYKNFGGIRIEDNVLITKDSYQILGDYIPKEILEIENI